MNTPLITLRAMEPEDLDDLYAIENDTEIWNVGHTNVPYSRYALHDYIANASADIFADKQVRMIIEDRKKQMIGIVDVVNFEPQHLRAELGIVIKKAFRNEGYGHAAVAAIIDYARRFWHLHQLYVLIDTDNQPSLHLFEQMGFSAGGTLKSWLYDGKEYHDACLMQTFL